jgi:hypothetical protein
MEKSVPKCAKTRIAALPKFRIAGLSSFLSTALLFYVSVVQSSRINMKFLHGSAINNRRTQDL